MRITAMAGSGISACCMTAHEAALLHIVDRLVFLLFAHLPPTPVLMVLDLGLV